LNLHQDSITYKDASCPTGYYKLILCGTRSSDFWRRRLTLRTTCVMFRSTNTPSLRLLSPRYWDYWRQLCALWPSFVQRNLSIVPRCVYSSSTTKFEFKVQVFPSLYIHLNLLCQTSFRTLHHPHQHLFSSPHPRHSTIHLHVRSTNHHNRDVCTLQVSLHPQISKTHSKERIGQRIYCTRGKIDRVQINGRKYRAEKERKGHGV